MEKRKVLTHFLRGNTLRVNLERQNGNYFKLSNVTEYKQLKTSPNNKASKWGNIKQWIKSTYLPSSLNQNENFIGYCKWSFISAICGSMNYVISTQALLMCLGMPEASSLGLSVGLNWILKDGLGQAGGVLFASKVGHLFDSEPKKFRLVSIALMQLASCIELLTPHFPAAFLIIASFSNVCKNISWIALSACRAHIHKSFSSESDTMGELTAKVTSQNTTASVFGTGIGIFFSAVFLNGTLSSQLLSFIPFGILAIISMVKSNSFASVNSFNCERMQLLFKNCKKIKHFSSPHFISCQQSLFYRMPHRIMLNVPFQQQQLKDAIFLLSEKETFLMGIETTSKTSKRLFLWFSSNASAEEIIRGYFSALCKACNEEIPNSSEWEKIKQELQKLGWNLQSQFIVQEKENRFFDE